MSPELKQALAAFAIAMAAIVVIVQLGAAIPPIGRHAGALVAVVFLYVPAAFAWRRGRDLGDYGLRLAPLKTGVALGVGVPLVVFPVFAAAFFGFYELLCRADAGALAALAPPGMCRSYRGAAGAALPPLSWGLAEAAFVQVVVVAIPEELFFRGFVHDRLERALPPRRRIAGGGVGWALVLSSALFALGHLAAGFDPRRLSVVFPGLLFGWMRSKTGSILAGAFAHALSNLFLDGLERTFF